MTASVRTDGVPDEAKGAMPSWRDGPAKKAILAFVAAACGHDGSEPVPPEERVAVFDNDGTLWCEKPVPIQMDFILRRFVEMAQADPALRERQPWKAASENDHAWFATVMKEHYAGDDHNVKTLAGGVLAAYAGVSVEDFETRADAFLRGTQHPTLGRGYLDDGPEKPIRIWSRTGRRPLLAAGISNGDIPMLDFTQHEDKPFLRLLVLHDDAEREFDYTAGAEQAVEEARRAGWTTVSVRNDWATVF